MKPPTLFDGYFGAVRLGRPAGAPPPSEEDLEGNPKPTVYQPEAISLLLGEISRRRRRPPTQSSSPETASNPAPPRSPHSVFRPRGGYRAAETPKKAHKQLAPPEPRRNIQQFQTSYEPRPSPSRTRRGTPSESESRGQATRTRGEFRPSSSYRGTSRAPANRPKMNTPD